MKEQLEDLVHKMHREGLLYDQAVREFKKRFVLTVLAENRGNQCRAAKHLNMHRNTLSRILIELEIDVKQVRVASRRPPRSVASSGTSADTPIPFKASANR